MGEVQSLETNNNFVHLHTHSEYSLLESSCRTKAMAKKAAALGMSALALTDKGNMYGAIEFYFACKDAGVRPILGLEAYLAANSRKEKNEKSENSQLVLLAASLEGYRNLCRVSTASFQEGFYYKPRADFEVLGKFNQDLVCLTGGLQGPVAMSFRQRGKDHAREVIRQLKAIYKDSLYLEVQAGTDPFWQVFTPFLQEMSGEFGLPLVAAGDVHFLTPEDQISQDVLTCIGGNRLLADEHRARLGPQYDLKSPQIMRELFAEHPQWCDQTLEIAQRCQLEFRLKDDKGKPIYHLPSFPTAQSRTVQEEIKARAIEGLQSRVAAALPGSPEAKSYSENPTGYQKRLEYELSVIEGMGFSGYFLIVSDFINWAKGQGIPVGPGRGSAAGSLVAYALRITDVDPVPYGLLFERFLNPERVSMPDIDVDFCQDRRQDVIEYVISKYGSHSVSQIVTFGKLQCRAAIKDVGRVLGLSFAEVDQVSKLIPEKLGMTVETALELEPRLQELGETDPKIGTLLDLAKRVEGLVRHVGIHAAGVIIADGNLGERAPLSKGAGDEVLVQYDMKNSEKVGLIKFDFLGLKTLTHIHRALSLVKANRGRNLSVDEINIHDPEIYKLIASGDTSGVFQFEGDGITEAILQIRPQSFVEITAVNALYRPGPMAMIPEYSKRKHGQAPVEYVLEETREILEETHGVMVYQEQVMAIASRIAGYSLGEADLLRRAMGKKIKSEMDLQRERFLNGAKAKNFDEKKATELFELMVKFADYGFNKSHSAAYCVVAAQTAWLKHYYPAEFFAALLSTELGDTDKIVKYVKDAQKKGLEVRPPHVQHSEFFFTVKGDQIYFGLGGIKGIGEAAIAAILEARTRLGGSFSSLEQFFTEVDGRRVNKKAIEVLIKAGALDGWVAHRAELFANYPRLLERAESARQDREVGQYSFFSMDEQPEEKLVLADTPAWSRSESLAAEKEVLGFYLTDHPLHSYSALLKGFSLKEIGGLSAWYAKVANHSLPPGAKGPRVNVAGILVSVRESITRKGTRMAFGQLEDLTGSSELVIFPDVYERVRENLKSEKPVLVTGELEVEERGVKLMVEQVLPLADLLAKVRRVALHLEKVPEDAYGKVNALLRKSPGGTPVAIWMDVPESQMRVDITPTDLKGVHLSPRFLEDLRDVVGSGDAVELS